MPKYRKKPVVIDAYSLDGRDPELFGLSDVHRIRVGSPEADAWEEFERDAGEVVLWTDADGSGEIVQIEIHTLEGVMKADPTKDVMIVGVQGERYACKLDIFNETYESV